MEFNKPTSHTPQSVIVTASIFCSHNYTLGCNQYHVYSVSVCQCVSVSVCHMCINDFAAIIDGVENFTFLLTYRVICLTCICSSESC